MLVPTVCGRFGALYDAQINDVACTRRGLLTLKYGALPTVHVNVTFSFARV